MCSARSLRRLTSDDFMVKLLKQTRPPSSPLLIFSLTELRLSPDPPGIQNSKLTPYYQINTSKYSKGSSMKRRHRDENQLTCEAGEVLLQVRAANLVGQNVGLVEEEDDGGVVEPRRMDGGVEQSKTLPHAVLRKTKINFDGGKLSASRRSLSFTSEQILVFWSAEEDAGG